MKLEKHQSLSAQLKLGMCKITRYERIEPYQIKTKPKPNQIKFHKYLHEFYIMKQENQKQTSTKPKSTSTSI